MAEQFAQALDYGKPEAQPPAPLASRGADLMIFLEDRLEFRLWYA
jgi:hypothetical protein